MNCFSKVESSEGNNKLLVQNPKGVCLGFTYESLSKVPTAFISASDTSANLGSAGSKSLLLL